MCDKDIGHMIRISAALECLRLEYVSVQFEVVQGHH